MSETIKKIIKISLGIAGTFVILMFLLALVFGKNSRSGVSETSLPQGLGVQTKMMTNSGRLESAAPQRMSGLAADSVVSEIAEDKKIIKNGNLALKVEKTEVAAEKVTEVAKLNSGSVFASNFYERVKGSKSGTITLKVPVANFEKTISDIKKVATQVVSESTSGQDVTEEYIDLQAQLKNQQALEQQYLAILQKAQKIQDILDVTEQLSVVRGTIEQLQGRIKYLNSQADMATISVNLSEDVTVTPLNESWRPWQVVKMAFKTLVSKFQGLVDALIYLLIAVLPILVIIIGIVWLVYKAGKKILAKIKGNN